MTNVGSVQTSETDNDTHRARESRWPRRLQIAGLLVLAPACAEYLSAYDDSTGDPIRLIGGLLIFSPLYGAPALLVREVARRAGLGWGAIILLAAAFGLTEAGIVDQSLFSLDYRHIETWDEGVRGTFIGPLGLSAYNALNFIGGHVIFSICAPIALVEAFRPSRRHEPWLNRWTIGVFAALYLAASGLVLGDSLTNESSHASASQVVGSVIVVATLVVAAIALGRRPRTCTDRPAPKVMTVFLVSLVAAVCYDMTMPTWVGLAIFLPLLGIAGALLHRAARSRGWTVSHIVAVAAGFVLSRAALAFTYFPVIGDVSALRKYGHSAVFLVAMLVLCGLAWRRSSRVPTRPAGAAGLPAAPDGTSGDRGHLR